MITALKAEFRKILTIRSTWIIFAVSILLASVLIGFWVYGYRDEGRAIVNSKAFLDSVLTSAGVSGLVLSFIMLLLVGHEYRYNTIMYSLTSTNNRTKVFFAKFIAGAAVILTMGAVVVGLNAILFQIGQGMNDTASLAQQVPSWDAVWRMGAVFAGYAAFAFVLGMLLRNLICSIAVMLLVPTTVEGILSLLLKDNVKYLPFTALGNIAVLEPNPKALVSLAVVAGYTVVLGFVAWILFVQRDAN